MKKAKKVLALVLVLALTVAMSVAGTIAYLSDDDTQVNTFTTGNVAIDLWEDFGDNDKEGLEELIPSTGSAQDGTLKNGVVKKVFVRNTGSENAYVRVHIAIPQVLDNGDPDFDAGKNVLHFNYAEEAVGEGKWDWSKTTAAPYEGDFNYYETEIDGVKYNVYVVTYEAILPSGYETVDAIHQVYLDKKVTNDDITRIKDTIGDEWKIYVIAEGTQAAGFDNAYEALNEAFGVPGADGYSVDWTKVAENAKYGKTYAEANA